MATTYDIPPGIYAYDAGRYISVFRAYAARDCRRFDLVSDALAAAGGRFEVVRVSVHSASEEVG